MAEDETDVVASKISRWVWAPAGVLFAFSFAHSVSSRGIAAVILYSALIGIVIATVAVLAIIIIVKIRGGLLMWPHDVISFYLNSVFVGFGVYCISTFVVDLYVLLASPYFISIKSVFVGIITLYFGGMLFLARLRWRSIYGLIEVISGATVAGYRFVVDNGMSDPALFLVILTAGVYLVVRGFDNIHQGQIKEPIDRVAARFISPEPREEKL